MWADMINPVINIIEAAVTIACLYFSDGKIFNDKTMQINTTATKAILDDSKMVNTNVFTL